MAPLGLAPRGLPARRARHAALLVAAVGAACFAAQGFLAPAPVENTDRAPPALGRQGPTAPGALRLGRAVRTAQVGEGSSALGCAIRAAAAALCVVAAGRSAAGKRAGLVVRRVFPSMGHRPKQKVLRRLEPYGQIPAWSRRVLVKRRLKQPWRIRVTPKPSNYGRKHLERQRVRFHYNVKEKQMKKYMLSAFKRGIEYPVDNFLQQLESRLDNYVWRVGLAPTMAGARHFVREGHIQFMRGSMKEWATCNVPSMRLKVGDRVRVSDKKSSQNYGRLNHDDEGPVDVPDHIRWDREAMEGEYLAPCDWQDFGLHVDYKYIILCYSGQMGLRRRHIRYFEGSRTVIKKSYNGGRTRPTPENILNMKRGIGLNKRGRARPPCLWGRRRPLNNAYEVGRKNKM